MTGPSNPSAQREERLQDLIAAYLERLEAGQAEGREELLARHPEFAAELAEFFAAGDRLDDLVVPLRRAAEGESAADWLPHGRGAGVLGDFRILQEVGRGGMGVVYEAEQISLGRRVALKVLPLAATMDPRHLQRFHNEARAAASLHHEHIVPVYAVGSERAVHYYAMQFIDGWTLAQFLVRRRQSAEAPRPDGAATGKPPAAAPAANTSPQACATTVPSSPDAAYFRQAARWGVQAAEALEHAHQLGIVHRDIKPANLMLDGQGKLWVTDFGLARVGADSGLTLTGDLPGTLRYMSPQQALAKRLVIDHRTDLYSLGVTLYELLTGQPAVGGSTREEILRQIVFAEPRRPRHCNKAIPPDLETITLKAMAQEPEGRYATAQELADDLRHYLEDRPIRARRPTLPARARRWARRHQAVVWSAAVTVAMTLAVLGGSVGWVMRDQAARRDETEGKVREALQAAEPGLRKGNPWDPALISAAQQAKAQLSGGVVGPDLRARVEQLFRDLEMLTRLENARLQSAVGSQGSGFDYAGAARLYAAAFKWYGLDVTTLDPQEAARRVRASAICTRLVEGLDDWAYGEGGAPQRPIADLVDTDPWSRRLRGAAGRKDKATLEALAEGEEVLNQSPTNIVLLASALNAIGNRVATQRLLRRAQLKHPADFWINFKLGAALDPKTPLEVAEAIAFCRAALAILPQCAAAYNNLGNYLDDQGNMAEAITAYQRAIELQPDLAILQFNLGIALRRQGKLEAAADAYRQAIFLRPDYPEAYSDLGVALIGQQKLPQAIDAFKKAIELKPHDEPVHYNLVKALLDHGEPAETAVEAFRKLTGREPESAGAYYDIGVTLQQKAKLAEAVSAYERAIQLRPNYPEALCNLSAALSHQGRFSEALAAMRRGHELLMKRPGSDSRSAEWLRNAERMVELDARLPKILEGKARPRDADERIALAAFCGSHQPRPRCRYVAAVRFYAEAFAQQPQLASDLNKAYRYKAAAMAALAARGEGRDAGQLEERERARLRKQALDWLQADLARYHRLLETEPRKFSPVVRTRMQHWQKDEDFAGVRGGALARLPEAERQAWGQLWAEVEQLLTQAGAKARERK
jgi:serine/threonine protein kinase/Flp pilus assembly protein TadD